MIGGYRLEDSIKRTRLRLASVIVALSLAMHAACSNQGPTSPTPVERRISDLQAARDIIEYNQAAESGGSFRDRTVISRWESPIQVFVDSSIAQDSVREALSYWAGVCDIAFTIVSADAQSRLFVRAGTDGLGSVAIGRSLVDGTFPNNRIRTTLTVIHPDFAGCGFVASDVCAYLYLHEIGHTLGFLDHLNGTGLMAASGPARRQATPRETNMMRELYRLPHGARVQPDGTWQVVK